METIKILVIDDKMANLENAKKQFQNKNVQLTCCPLFSVATELLKKNQYDILLTDLMLPGEAKGIGKTNPEIGKEVPYGLIIAILGKKIGIKHVAILTDISHHSGPIANAMDNLLGESEYISCFPNKQWLLAAEKFVNLNENLETKELSAKKSLMLAGFNKNFLQGIKEKLIDKYEITLIEEKETNNLPVIYAEKMPNYLFLIGEINEKSSSTKFYVKKILDDIKQIKTAEQIVITAGFCDSDEPFFERLPITTDYLAKMLPS